MTKTNSFKITDKILVWAAIPVALLIAGLILFFTLGFNPSASIADSKTLVVNHDAYVNVDESLQDELLEVCQGVMNEKGLKANGYNVATTQKGGQIEFSFSADTDSAKLYELWTAIESKLGTNENLKTGVYSGIVHVNVSQYAYDYIWRAAISAGVALVLAFLYVFIRYRLSMGLATLIAGVADLAMMLSLTLILRLPVTTALATAGVFAVLYSVLVSSVLFNKIRGILKDEQYKDMPAKESMEMATKQTLLRIVILGGATIVVCALLAIFGGAAVASFALPALCGVAASTFSGAFLTPSLATLFNSFGDKKDTQ